MNKQKHIFILIVLQINVFTILSFSLNLWTLLSSIFPGLLCRVDSQNCIFIEVHSLIIYHIYMIIVHEFAYPFKISRNVREIMPTNSHKQIYGLEATVVY